MPASFHLWHDPWLTRAIVVLAHWVNEKEAVSHGRIVEVAHQRHRTKPVYLRNMAGRWEQLWPVGEYVNRRTRAKLMEDFPA